jgi:hypothetical protein
MKALPIFTFAAGGAAGALVMWFLHPSAAADETKAGSVTAARLTTENKTLSDKVQSLEKQIAAAARDKSGPGPDGDASSKPQVVTTRHFDDTKVEEMMKEHAGREANREADKLALRLKLTPEQKESLKKFLLARKESERAMFRSAMKEGGKVDPKKEGQSKDDFLKSLLTPEQQAEYARSQEEQRTARAEEYAQRKVRKLNDQLSLNEEQKDKLFQAYAQQKLTATDPAKAPAEPADAVKVVQGGTIAFASSSGAGGEPIEIDLDVGEMISPGSGDLDHSVMEGILTPEQLGVYDQRKAEEKERAKDLPFGLPPLPEGGGALRIKMERSETAPASPAK